MFKWKSSNIKSNYSISSLNFVTDEDWKISNGKSKKTNTNVSVWEFDKLKFESYLKKIKLPNSNINQVKEDVYNRLKTSVNNLSKFRHPQILKLIEPLEDHKSYFIFVTERINSNLYDLSIDTNLYKKGIYQVALGLNFILSNYNHLSINPNSIFINEVGDWKIYGFGHLTPLQNDQDYFLELYDQRIPISINLNLNYTPPELILNSKIYSNSDIWSLGALIYSLYNKNEYLLSQEPIENLNDYKFEFNKWNKNFKSNFKFTLSNLPQDLHPLILKLLQSDAHDRLNDLDQFIQDPFFQNDPIFQILIKLDDFEIISTDFKLQLIQLIDENFETIPKSILINKLLPKLINLFELKDEAEQYIELIIRSLQLIFKIGLTHLSNLSFYDLIFNKFKELNNEYLTNDKVLIIILNNISLIQPKISNSLEFNNFLILLTTKTLLIQDNDHVFLQVQSLKQLSTYLDHLEFQYLKNKTLSKILSIFQSTTSFNLKIQSIDSIELFLNHERNLVDKFLIKESILPVLVKFNLNANIKPDSKSIILVKILLILEKFITKFNLNLKDDLNFVINDILINLWIFGNDESLKLEDYKQFTRVINKLSNDIQSERLKVLTKDHESSISNNQRNSIASNTPTRSSNDFITKPNNKTNQGGHIKTYSNSSNTTSFNTSNNTSTFKTNTYTTPSNNIQTITSDFNNVSISRTGSRNGRNEPRQETLNKFKPLNPKSNNSPKVHTFNLTNDNNNNSSNKINRDTINCNPISPTNHNNPSGNIGTNIDNSGYNGYNAINGNKPNYTNLNIPNTSNVLNTTSTSNKNFPPGFNEPLVLSKNSNWDYGDDLI